MPYNKLCINLACSACTCREISDLGLFIQTPPIGLGLYKKTSVRYFSVQTSRSVNKKLIYFFLGWKHALQICTDKNQVIMVSKLNWRKVLFCLLNKESTNFFQLFLVMPVFKSSQTREIRKDVPIPKTYLDSKEGKEAQGTLISLHCISRSEKRRKQTRLVERK
jgi:hypothetical protein